MHIITYNNLSLPVSLLLVVLSVSIINTTKLKLSKLR